MNKNKKGLFSLALVLASSTLCAPGVFASNAYNINYSGGTALGSSNVITDKDFLDGLTPLITRSKRSTTVIPTDSNLAMGYYKDGDNCHKYYYFKVWADRTMTAADKYYYIAENDDYYAKIQFNKIILENISDLSENGVSIAVGVHETSPFPYIAAGNRLYTDSTCQNENTSIRTLRLANNERIFVQGNVSLYDKKTDKMFDSDETYISITDIDASQSYKILNSDSLLTAGKMYNKVAANLQPTTEEEGLGLKNMFVSSGNYIYSEFSDRVIYSDEKTDIYAPVGKSVAAGGLDFVFGFTSSAGSGINFLAQEYEVYYFSDDNGTITGDREESVFSGHNPSGAKEQPNDGYEFDYYVADIDVRLTDGSTIKAGEKITPAQIAKVIIENDTEFTAIHKKIESIPVPNTGSSTGEYNGEYIAISLVSIAILALAIGVMPRLFHKRNDFKR